MFKGLRVLLVAGLLGSFLGCRPAPEIDQSEAESFKPELDQSLIKKVETVGEMRTWKPASGGAPIEGELIRVEGGTVFIKKKNGHQLGIPLGKLSPEDQNYARQAGS